MTRKLLILCSFTTTALFPQDEQNPRDLLLRIRDRLKQTVDRLPKYLCTQTVDRREYRPVLSEPVSSCARLLDQRKSPDWIVELSSSDRLHLDVAVSTGNEMYSWAGTGRFDDADLTDLVPHGAVSTGSFSSFLTMIFSTDETNFSYNAEITAGGRTFLEYGFRTPLAKSHYYFRTGSRRVAIAYDGTFLADRETLDLVRLAVHSGELPSETGACEATSTLTYGRVHLNDADFLLPSETLLRIVSSAGVEAVNRTVYTACHEFRGESVLKSELPQDLPASNAASGKQLDVPAGLPFTVILTQDIDTSTAAAGDSIAAELATPIRDPTGTILVAKGAALTGRILRIRHNYLPDRSWELTIGLETLDVAGTRVPFSANAKRVPGRGTAGFEPSGLSTRLQLRSTTFEFRKSAERFVTKKGLTSDWVTSAPP
jgi:hypothetical protein